ncbi:hypothetical protein MRX96_040932 [Rhipicephalus microplus]
MSIAAVQERWLRAASIGCVAFTIITLVSLIAIAIIVAMVSSSFPLYVTPRNRRRCRAPHLVDCSSEAAQNLSGLVRHHAWFFMADDSVAGGGTCLEWIQGHMCHDYSRNRFRSRSSCRAACENALRTTFIVMQGFPVSSARGGWNCSPCTTAYTLIRLVWLRDEGQDLQKLQKSRRFQHPRSHPSSDGEEATTYQEAPTSPDFSGRKTLVPKANTTPKLKSTPDEEHRVWQWWFYDPLLHACRHWKDVCVFRGYTTMAECTKACVFM